jgi:hypothetical protein
MEAGIFALLGVVVAAFLSLLKEWWLQGRKELKDSEYSAVQVVIQLDRFVAECAHVVGEVSTYVPIPSENGYGRIQETPPKFEPDALKVEWKLLPPKLMYKVFDLPLRADIAHLVVRDAFQIPDFGEGFEEWQIQYATLGLEAAALARALRIHAELPANTREGWEPENYLREQRAHIEKKQLGRAPQTLNSSDLSQA